MSNAQKRFLDLMLRLGKISQEEYDKAMLSIERRKGE